MQVIDAGRMRNRVTRLTLGDTETGVDWLADGLRYARIEWPTGRSIFSAVAMAARPVKLTMRHDPRLSLRHALRLDDGTHLFLTRITPQDNRLYMTVEAAAVRLSACAVTRTRVDVDPTYNRPRLAEKQVLTFPAVLSERYLTNRQDTPQTTTTDRMVLTCPKAVTLRVGEVVTVDGHKYVVRILHELDPDRNDYEIERKEDA